MASSMDHTVLMVVDGGQKTYPERLPVKRGGRVAYVRVEEVDWIEARRNYVWVHRGGESYTIRRTMISMETDLDPRKFIRIHRSTIVNIDRIKALRPLISGHVIVELDNGSTLPLGRSYRRKLSPQIQKMGESGMSIQ